MTWRTYGKKIMIFGENVYPEISSEFQSNGKKSSVHTFSRKFYAGLAILCNSVRGTL